jgi:TrpR-related protein YerC/YecD
MQSTADDWRSADVEALFDVLLDLESRDEAAAFLRDLCTLGEIRDLAQRWTVVRLLGAGLHYSEISRRTGASTATITRIASWLNHGEGGYRLLLERSLQLERSSSRGSSAGAADSATPGTTRYPKSDEHRTAPIEPSAATR